LAVLSDILDMQTSKYTNKNLHIIVEKQRTKITVAGQ